MAIKSTIYDSAKRKSPALEELNGVIQYRDLIYQLVRRDIVSRYKRSVLGIAWTMIQPLGLMIILSIVFSNLFQNVRGYPSYLLSGLIAWTFFSQTTTAAIHQIVWGGSLMNKIYLPRTVFAISAIGTGLVNFVISLIPLTLIMMITGTSLHWSILFVPVAMIMLAVFALGVGLILSTMGCGGNVSDWIGYVDVSHTDHISRKHSSGRISACAYNSKPYVLSYSYFPYNFI
jgi:ABC-type polysaccharide/polyol phosphate export permease